VVSRRLPTAAARVRGQVRSCGICGRKSGTGTGSTSISPANSHSTDCSTFTIVCHPGLVESANEWPKYQTDSVSPHPKKLKKKSKKEYTSCRRGHQSVTKELCHGFNHLNRIEKDLNNCNVSIGPVLSDEISMRQTCLSFLTCSQQLWLNLFPIDVKKRL
jgi:hypothetical protein